VDPELAAAIEEAIWSRMHFATHLRARRLGEFTIGTELFRSESLALVQLLILYHLVTARATVALGGQGTRAAGVQGAGASSGEPLPAARSVTG
jgi:phosphoribulokinase